MSTAGPSRGGSITGDTVLVCFAVKEEAAPFRPFAESKPWVQVQVTGIGQKNTERALVKSLAGPCPKMVLTCGFAGGLDPGLRTGEVLFDTVDATLREALAAAGARPGQFHCADRIATSVEEKARLRASSGADAVEMESAHVRRACAREGLPVATVRVILDTASEDLPLDFSQLMAADETVSMGKLAVALLKSPGKVPALLRLQRQTRASAQALACVLEKALECLARKQADEYPR